MNATIRNLTQTRGTGSHGKFLREAVSGFSLCFRKLTLGAVWKMNWGGRQGELRQRQYLGPGLETPCLWGPGGPSLSFPTPGQACCLRPQRRAGGGKSRAGKADTH